MLVEVLATMTISALILAALFSIASLTFRASASVERHSDAIEQRSRLLSTLSREIERARPVRWAGKDGDFLFQGSTRSLAFAAEVPSTDGTMEMMAIAIDGAQGVVRRAGSIAPDALSFDDIAMRSPESMADNTFNLAFAYYARLPDGREALMDDWPDARQLPSAIRLTVSGRDGMTSVLRVRLAVDAETGCGFPKAGHCSLSPPTAPDEAAASQPTKGDGG